MYTYIMKKLHRSFNVTERVEPVAIFKPVGWLVISISFETTAGRTFCINMK